MTKKTLFIIKLILLTVIIWWIVKSVDLNETFSTLSKVNINLFVFAFIVNNISTLFLTIKWHRLASPLHLKSSFSHLLKLNYISIFYSSFIPGQSSGELIKGLKLTRSEKAIQKVWIPIFIDKITNLLMVFLVGFIGIAADSSLRSNASILASASIFTILFAAMTVILFSEHTEKFTNFLKKKLITILEYFKIDTSIFKDFSVTYFESYKKHNYLMLETILWSFFVKLPHIFAFYLLALSLNLNLDLVKIAWIFATVSIVTLIPISFSGLGVREGVVIVILKNLEISSPNALSFSILIFTINTMAALIGAVLEVLSWFKADRKS